MKSIAPVGSVLQIILWLGALTEALEPLGDG